MHDIRRRTAQHVQGENAGHVSTGDDTGRSKVGIRRRRSCSCYNCARRAVVLVGVMLMGRWGLEWQCTSYSNAFVMEFDAGYAAGVHGPADIPRLHVANLSVEQVQSFVHARRPFIGIVERGWNIPFNWTQLRADCGSMPLDMANHYMVGLSGAVRWAATRKIVDGLLSPWTSADLLLQLAEPWTLAKYMDAAHTDLAPRAEYSSALSYIWPPSVHSTRFGEPCMWHELAFHAALTKLRMGINAAYGLGEIVWPMDLFVAPQGSRAYPLHQHGRLNENLLLVLSGSKQVFIFPPSADAALSERPEAELSELSDRVFAADPVQAVAEGVRAAVAVVRAGEAIYIPANTIHLIENLEDVVAVALHIGVMPGASAAHIEEREYVGGRWQPTAAHLAPRPMRLARSLLSGGVIWDHLFRPQRVVVPHGTLVDS